MRYYTRLQVYKAPNVIFNPKTIEAYSYRWWKFVSEIEGKVVFNDYRYSVTTSIHQSKVRRILQELGIKVDISAPFPDGIKTSSLEEAILQGEEGLCDQYLREEEKKISRNEKSKTRKLKRALTDYLENSVHFRDYEIRKASQFGHYNKIAVHQVVESKSLARDVENAIYNFHRDCFGSIVFYI